MVCPPGRNSAGQTPCLAVSFVRLFSKCLTAGGKPDAGTMKVRYERSYRQLAVVLRGFSVRCNSATLRHVAISQPGCWLSASLAARQLTELLAEGELRFYDKRFR
jgi:hypothetical protein